MINKYKYIQGYENEYGIDINGNIYSYKTKKIIKQRLQTNKKYMTIILCKNGKKKNYRVHRLVALTYIPENDLNKQVNHKDGNTFNNNYNNLEWVTAKYNVWHSFHITKKHKPSLNFLGKFGKNHNRSKPFIIKHIDGSIKEYGSAFEFKRETGLDNTVITWARSKNKKEYVFTRGKVKGLTVIF